MMKGIKKRMVCMMLLGIMVASMIPQTDKAAEVERIEADDIGNGSISICAEYASDVTTTLSIANDGTASIKASVRGIAGVTTKIHAKVVLQKYSNGSWSAVKTYEDTVEKTLYFLSKTQAVSKGKYRIKGVYTVYKGVKSEKVTKYSKTVTFS